MKFIVLATQNSGMTIDRIIIDYFNGLGAYGNFLLVIICLLLSIILGGCIGYQREVSGHAAGLRTHVLFSLGCCLLTIISVYGGLNSFGGEYDTARITAGVVGGAGFLGAGTIIHNGVTIKGLTTAATLWMSMAIGVTCGYGWIIVAVIATILSCIVLICLVKLEDFASRKNINIMMIVAKDNNAIPKLLEISDESSLTIKDINTTLATYKEESVLRITFSLCTRDKKRAEVLLNTIRAEISPISLDKIQ